MEEQYIEIDKDGNKHYYKNKGMTIGHRLDGPAVEWADGYKSWWVDDKPLSEGEFNALSKPLELTLEQIAAKFGVDVNKIKLVK